MNCKISGKQINLGESLTEYAKNALSDIVKKYYGKDAEFSVIVSKENGNYESDISVHLKRGVTINAHGENADPYACIEDAGKKIIKQLQKNKQITRSKKDRISEFLFKTNLDNPETNAEFYGSEENAPLVIADIIDNIPTMTVKEATEALTNTPNQVLVFRNGNKVNVVYWRNDRNIGWVQT